MGIIRRRHLALDEITIRAARLDECYAMGIAAIMSAVGMQMRGTILNHVAPCLKQNQY